MFQLYLALVVFLYCICICCVYIVDSQSAMLILSYQSRLMAQFTRYAYLYEYIMQVLLNPLMPIVAIRVQLLGILCRTGLSHHL